jgi:hypothetical protein
MTTQLVFEDPYEDEYESDGDVAAQEQEEDGGDGTEMDELEDQLRVWRPGIDTLGEDEVSFLLAHIVDRAHTCPCSHGRDACRTCQC